MYTVYATHGPAKPCTDDPSFIAASALPVEFLTFDLPRTGNFVATVSADLKVGGVTEAITVSGEAPVVDVTSARTQQTLSGQTVAEIPTSRSSSTA